MEKYSIETPIHPDWSKDYIDHVLKAEVKKRFLDQMYEVIKDSRNLLCTGPIEIERIPKAFFSEQDHLRLSFYCNVVDKRIDVIVEEVQSRYQPFPVSYTGMRFKGYKKELQR